MLRRDFEFLSGERGITGWIRRDVSRELYRELATDPEAFVSRRPAAMIRDRPKSKLFRRVVNTPGGVEQSLIVKRVRYDSLSRRIGFLFVNSPALRSLRGALILQQRGLDTPLPIAAVEPRSWNGLGTSYYIAEEIQDSESLRALWQISLPAVPRRCTLRKRVRVLKGVASLVHRLHSMGIFHQDLKGTNILLRENATDAYSLFLVDVGDVTKTRCLVWRKRVRNLIQMCEVPGRFWTAREKALFLKHYCDLSGLSKIERHNLVGEVFSSTDPLNRAS